MAKDNKTTSHNTKKPGTKRKPMNTNTQKIPFKRGTRK
jgi:hypothetical protein